MHKTVEIICFKHRDTSDGSEFLTETGGTVAARIKFLRTVHDFRISGS